MRLPFRFFLCHTFFQNSRHEIKSMIEYWWYREKYRNACRDRSVSNLVHNPYQIVRDMIIHTFFYHFPIRLSTVFTTYQFQKFNGSANRLLKTPYENLSFQLSFADFAFTPHRKNKAHFSAFFTHSYRLLYNSGFYS